MGKRERKQAKWTKWFKHHGHIIKEIYCWREPNAFITVIHRLQNMWVLVSLLAVEAKTHAQRKREKERQEERESNANSSSYTHSYHFKVYLFAFSSPTAKYFQLAQMMKYDMCGPTKYVIKVSFICINHICSNGHINNYCLIHCRNSLLCAIHTYQTDPTSHPIPCEKKTRKVSVGNNSLHITYDYCLWISRCRCYWFLY